MKGPFKAAWAAILGTTLFCSGVEALSLEEVVARVQQRYEKTQAFTADFQQTSLLRSLNKEQKSTGKVYIRKPGKMRWEYETPEQQLIVSDGKTVWIYTPSLGQVIENPLSTAYDSKTPALFLAGLGNIEEDFVIRFSPRYSDASEGDYILELRPKDSQLYLSKLEITVNRKDFIMEQSIAHDPMGNVITLQFSNIQTNVDLSVSTFQFQVPEGAERIRPPTFPSSP